MKKTNTTRFAIDFVNQKIIGTKASFNKASKGYGAEYEELSAKINAHPTYELIVKEQKSKSPRAKITYSGLNFKLMEDYISIQQDEAILIKEYEAVKKMAKDCGSKVYPFTKKWFLGKFSKFNIEEAKEQISDYRIAQAQNSVSANDLNAHNILVA